MYTLNANGPSFQKANSPRSLYLKSKWHSAFTLSKQMALHFKKQMDPIFLSEKQMAPRFYTMKANCPSFQNGPQIFCKKQMAPHFLYLKSKWPLIAQSKWPPSNQNR